MKLHAAPDDPMTGLVSRLVSEGGTVEAGVYRVLYGYRVRAGFINSPVCEIDWCCGDNVKQLESHLVAAALFLRRRPEDEFCFDGLPKTSTVKPCWTDAEFEQRLTDAMLTIPEMVQ